MKLKYEKSSESVVLVSQAGYSVDAGNDRHNRMIADLLSESTPDDGFTWRFTLGIYDSFQNNEIGENWFKTLEYIYDNRPLENGKITV